MANTRLNHHMTDNRAYWMRTVALVCTGCGLRDSWTGRVYNRAEPEDKREKREVRYFTCWDCRARARQIDRAMEQEDELLV